MPIPAITPAMVLLPVPLAIGFLLLVTLGLFIWGRRVAQWRPHPAWKWVSFLPFLGLCCVMAGVGVTIAALVTGYRSSTVTASSGSTLGASGFVEVELTWFLAAVVVYLLSAVALFIGTVTRGSVPEPPQG